MFLYPFVSTGDSVADLLSAGSAGASKKCPESGQNLFFRLQDELVKSAGEPAIADMHGDKFPSLVRGMPVFYPGTIHVTSAVSPSPHVLKPSAFRKVALGIAIEGMFVGLMQRVFRRELVV
jgi:hypothetical protein